MKDMVLLGDEAFALGTLHAGLSAGFGYPGTPSTEIMEYLIDNYERNRAKDAQTPVAQWCSNEKTALEAALGVSFAGRRAVVTMKHVGLNVAADPFMNAALCGIKGGLIIAVADDPSMHSSQGEQDSRFYADFAMVPCFEPTTQQEAYEMAFEAFDVSEKYHVPVIMRFVTRLSHSRAVIHADESKIRAQNTGLLPVVFPDIVTDHDKPDRRPALVDSKGKYLLLVLRHGQVRVNQAGLVCSYKIPLFFVHMQVDDPVHIVPGNFFQVQLFIHRLLRLLGCHNKTSLSHFCCFFCFGFFFTDARFMLFHA